MTTNKPRVPSDEDIRDALVTILQDARLSNYYGEQDEVEISLYLARSMLGHNSATVPTQELCVEDAHNCGDEGGEYSDFDRIDFHGESYDESEDHAALQHLFEESPDETVEDTSVSSMLEKHGPLSFGELKQQMELSTDEISDRLFELESRDDFTFTPGGYDIDSSYGDEQDFSPEVE